MAAEAQRDPSRVKTLLHAALRIAVPHGRFALRFYDPLELPSAAAVSIVGVVGLIALGVVAHKAGRGGEPSRPCPR